MRRVTKKGDLYSFIVDMCSVSLIRTLFHCITAFCIHRATDPRWLIDNPNILR